MHEPKVLVKAVVFKSLPLSLVHEEDFFFIIIEKNQALKGTKRETRMVCYLSLYYLDTNYLYKTKYIYTFYSSVFVLQMKIREKQGTTKYIIWGEAIFFLIQ